MTDGKQHINIKGKVEDSPKHSTSKRALLRGAVAVPVVLTLRSGAAFAIASTGSCVTRDNKDAGNVEPPVLVGGDTWLRRSGFCTTLTLKAASTLSNFSNFDASSRGGNSVPSYSGFSEFDDSQRRGGFGPGINTIQSTSFTVYTDDQNGTWQHELNTPDGTKVDGSGSNTTYVITDATAKEMALSDRREIIYTYTTIFSCEILVQVHPGVPSGTMVTNLDIGAAKALANNAGLPYISASCWASVEPTAVQATRY